MGILFVRSSIEPFTEFSKLLTDFLNCQKRKIVQSRIISHQEADSIRMTIIAVALFTTVLTLLITIWIGSGTISRPILSIAEAMRKLA